MTHDSKPTAAATASQHSLDYDRCEVGEVGKGLREGLEGVGPVMAHTHPGSPTKPPWQCLTTLAMRRQDSTTHSAAAVTTRHHSLDYKRGEIGEGASGLGESLQGGTPVMAHTT